MKTEEEIAAHNAFIKEFKQLCNKYGYVDQLLLKGIEQDISIRVKLKIRNDGVITSCIKKSKNNIRHQMTFKGNIEEIIPIESPEDIYHVLNIVVDIKRIEEKVELLNRQVDKSNSNIIKKGRIPKSNVEFEDNVPMYPLNPDPYAKY